MWWWFTKIENKIDTLTQKVADIQATVDRIISRIRNSN